MKDADKSYFKASFIIIIHQCIDYDQIRDMMLLICLQNDVNDDDNNHDDVYDVFLTKNFMVFCLVNMKVKQL